MHVKRLCLENYFLFPYEQTKIFFPTFSSWKTTELFPYYPSLENDQTFSETFPDSAGSPYLWKKSCLKTSSLNLCSVSDAQQPEIGLYMTNENYSRKAAGFAWASRKLQDVIKSSFNLTQAPSTSVWRCTSHNWRERSSTVSDPCEAVVVNGTSSKASSKSHNTLVTPWRSKKACVR